MSRIQHEIDGIIAAMIEDMARMEKEFETHGLPIRVDRFGGARVWLFNDGFQFRVE
ncbi:MAG: hypothetical protein K5853_06885 [Lachnospiraceae bacterium]|nr:hypothetical protein [Lachnospiraceae bacterium]